MSEFSFRPATGEQIPLLLGLIGPTWTGKTYSALRVGAGIVSVRGGKLVGIDTEARRMLQYANDFTFSYSEFGPPFSSLRYSDCLKAAAQEAQGGCVIVDSQSHEHEGPGGYLELHEQEVQRLIKSGGFNNEYAAGIPAWAKPSAQRRVLINTILQLNCAFIFCFRAKEKIKPVRGGNPLELGWQAIAGEEFGYEMTARCLLKPGSKGVPDWSEEAERLGVPKRIKAHESIFRDGRQLDEATGQELATWAKNLALKTTKQPAESLPVNQKATVTQPAGEQASPKGLIDNALASGETGSAAVTTYISADEESTLIDLLESAGISIKTFLQFGKLTSLAKLPADRYEGAKQWIAKNKVTA